MKESDRLIERLCELAGASAAGLDAPEASAGAVRALMQRVGADRCVLTTLTPDGRIRAAEAWTIEGGHLRSAAEAVSHFLIRQAVQTRAPVYVEDARKDRRWRSQYALAHHKTERSLAGLPVLRGEALIAVVCLSHDTVPLRYDEADWAPLLCAQLLVRGSVPAAAQGDVPAARGPQQGAAASGALSEPFVWQGFMTRSPSLRDVLREAARIAPSALPVLIVGEDGTGKDLLAHAVHVASGRSGRLVTADLGAIPEGLVEAELFGHEAGAFTGAVAARRGLIEEAQAGTLFLDDLQEAPKALQAALLRVLAEGVVRPLGGGEPRRVDFRLIAAGTLSFEALRSEKIVREDLLYRIHGAVFTLSPLRARAEDIAPLFARFLAEFGGGRARELSAEAETALVTHTWPGNVRELRNEAQRLAALGGGTVQAGDLSWMRAGGGAIAGKAAFPTLAYAVEEIERAHVRRALDLSLGNKSRAAKLLGITRRSLYRRLASYGLLGSSGSTSD